MAHMTLSVELTVRLTAALASWPVKMSPSHHLASAQRAIVWHQVHFLNLPIRRQGLQADIPTDRFIISVVAQAYSAALDESDAVLSGPCSM